MKQLAKYLLVFCLLLLSCSEPNSVKKSYDQEYFPLAIGSYQIYTVDETVYTGLNQSTTAQYELRTSVVDSFQSLDGTTTYVIHRSRRENENSSWEVMDTWSARITKYEAVVNEGNTSYIRISFPAFTNRQWNGNALNTLLEDLYLLEKKNTMYEIDNGQSFDDCVIVNQEEYLDELSKNDRQEVYARGIGLVYKKYIVLNYCDDNGCFGQQKIESGLEYYQSLKEYGQN